MNLKKKLLKKLLKWANKKRNNFKYLQCCIFLKKIMKNTCRYYPKLNDMIYSSRDIKILKKMKKMAGDIILLYIHVYRKWRYMIYGSWNIRCDRQKSLTFWYIFCPFSPLTNQNFNIEKTPGDIIILHNCTINDNHLMYGSWDKEHNRYNFLSFWTVFCTFAPYGPRKSKKFLKWKKHLKTLSIYRHKWQSYDVWFLRYGVQQRESFVILGHFLPFYPLTTQKTKILKKSENSWRYYHFTQV